MTDGTEAQAFAAFRELVFEDFNIRTWLQAPLELEAYVRRVVAAGAEAGFVFTAEKVRGTMRAAKLNSMMQGCDPI